MRAALAATMALTALAAVAPPAAAAPLLCNFPTTSAPNSGPATVRVNALAGLSGAQLRLVRGVEGAPIDATGETGSIAQVTGTVDLTRAAPGLWSLEARTPDGGSCAGNFTVVATGVPTVTAVTPATVRPGTQGVVLTVTGTNLFRGAGVAVDDEDGARADIVVTATSFGPATDATQRRVTIDVPPVDQVKLGTHDVVVTNADGNSVRCVACLRVVLDPPTVASVTPPVLERGLPTTVTVTGTGFGPGTTVAFGEGVTVGAPTVTATTVVVQATAAADAALGARTVVVTNGAGQAAACTCVVVIANHENWIAAVYRDLLGRAPDAAGRSAWLAYLRGGGSRTNVALGVVTSNEARGFVVEDFYSALLGRHPDPAGRAGWVQALASISYVDFEAALLGSSEFYGRIGRNNGAWVDSVYVAAVGRFPDSASRATWLSLLNQGHSRTAIATSILGSLEARNRQVASFYQAYLRRSADVAGRNAWARLLAGGMREEHLIAQILASNEYFTKAG